MNKQDIIKYHKAHKVSVELLKSVFKFHYVFPKFFLSLLKNQFPNLYKAFTEFDLLYIEFNYQPEIDKALKLYEKELDEINHKVEIICDVNGYSDNLEILQNVMDKLDLIEFISSIDKEEIGFLENITEINYYLKKK